MGSEPHQRTLEGGEFLSTTVTLISLRRHVIIYILLSPTWGSVPQGGR